MTKIFYINFLDTVYNPNLRLHEIHAEAIAISWDLSGDDDEGDADESMLLDYEEIQQLVIQLLAIRYFPDIISLWDGFLHDTNS